MDCVDVGGGGCVRLGEVGGICGGCWRGGKGGGDAFGGLGGEGGCDERSVAQDLNTAVGAKMLRVVREGNARVGCGERFRFGGFGGLGHK